MRRSFSKSPTQHGKSWTPAWRSRNAMIQRCMQEKSVAYTYYGGRGIKVCARWLGDNGFAAFLADMGERPDGKSIDRFPDRDGDYTPDNCRWATNAEQARNTARAKMTDVDVALAQSLRRSGTRIDEIAKRFNVGKPHISRVTRGHEPPPDLKRCRRGHLMTSDNIYTFRRGNGTTSKICATCRREGWERFIANGASEAYRTRSRGNKPSRKANAP